MIVGAGARGDEDAPLERRRQRDAARGPGNGWTPRRGTSATPTPAAASEQATEKSPVSATMRGSKPAERQARRTSSPQAVAAGGTIQSRSA